MRNFDYSFLEYGMLPAGLVNIVSTIAELKGRGNERKNNFADTFSKLESSAKIQSIKGSNEIDGIVTSQQRVNEIVNQNSAPQNHSEEEIAGYRDALALVHGAHMGLDIRERDILWLHEITMSYAPAKGGKYKKTDNPMVDIDAKGRKRVRFTPTPAAATKITLARLIHAYTKAKNNDNINQLLLIPCFILDFLCIHPFDEGNGRMSRLLSSLLLIKNGFDVGRYVSFEWQINRSKNAYVHALKDSSVGWHKGQNSYFPFMENFVTTLLFCYVELDKRFTAGSKKVTKRQRIENVVLDSTVPISKGEINAALPDVSQTMIEVVLGEMFKDGLVKKVGAGRNTKYIKQEAAS
jgi:Fic family protein